MSGWIRVKELPTRYEVHGTARLVYYDRKNAKQARRNVNEWDVECAPARLVTVRRWQVERTGVTENRSSYATYYDNGMSNVIRVVREYGTLRWTTCLELGATFKTRQKAEAAARKWLRDNGYRIVQGVSSL